MQHDDHLLSLCPLLPKFLSSIPEPRFRWPAAGPQLQPQAKFVQPKPKYSVDLSSSPGASTSEAASDVDDSTSDSAKSTSSRSASSTPYRRAAGTPSVTPDPQRPEGRPSVTPRSRDAAGSEGRPSVTLKARAAVAAPSRSPSPKQPEGPPPDHLLPKDKATPKTAQPRQLETSFATAAGTVQELSKLDIEGATHETATWVQLNSPDGEAHEYVERSAGERQVRGRCCCSVL